MEEQLISFETAKLAKEKGFDLKEHCTCGGFPDCICDTIRSKIVGYIYRPTQSLLQKWLREKHNIKVYATPSFANIDMYNYEIQYDNKLKTSYTNDIYKIFKTFEEALEEGLFEALKLI